MTVTSDLETLAKINAETLLNEGECFPTVQFKNGLKVPTGTVGALLENIKKYNESDTLASKAQIETNIKMTIPTLLAVGLFDLFPPIEWMSDKNPGRTLVGTLAAQHIQLANQE